MKYDHMLYLTKHLLKVDFSNIEFFFLFIRVNFRAPIDEVDFNAQIAKRLRHHCGVAINTGSPFAMHAVYTTNCTMLIGRRLWKKIPFKWVKTNIALSHFLNKNICGKMHLKGFLGSSRSFRVEIASIVFFFTNELFLFSSFSLAFCHFYWYFDFFSLQTRKRKPKGSKNGDGPAPKRANTSNTSNNNNSSTNNNNMISLQESANGKF